MPFLTQYTKRSLVTIGALALLTAATAVQARTLSYASARPPTDIANTRVLTWWADEIQNCTEGSIEIKFHYMGSLTKLSDALSAVSAGVADIAYVSAAYTAAKLPLWDLANTSYGSGDQYVATEAFRRVRERLPAIKAEEKANNLKYISHISNGGFVLVSSTRPYITPADFNGDKVRLPGTFSKIARVADWPVTVVSLHFADIYSALGRGTIDGAMAYAVTIPPHKLNEVVSYVVEPNVGQNTNSIFMNRDTWSSLSEETQQCFNGLQDELLLRLAKETVADENKFRQTLQNHPTDPLEFYSLEGEHRQVWINAFEAGSDIAVDEASQFTDSAQRLVELYREELEEVEEEVENKGYPWKRK